MEPMNTGKCLQSEEQREKSKVKLSIKIHPNHQQLLFKDTNGLLGKIRQKRTEKNPANKY